MSPWWPCGGCGGSCFAPCDCFTKNCELELTIAGWEDNASTDCAGIANNTFNGTHTITGLNVTSSSPYGFSCDFTLTFDDLVLTKLVGGSCQCKVQSALYTIDGTLQCGGSGPDDFSYTLLLTFRVPVYDEDAGCSPSPCTVQAQWEDWVADGIELYNGPLSGNPICTTDLDPVPVTWTVTPSAETTCGLGLDGTTITVGVRFKLCDPDEGAQGGQPCLCCDEAAIGDLPDQMQVVLSGYENNGFSATPCENCAAIDGTYVLERESGGCFWRGCFEVEPCVTEIPIDRVIIELWPSNITAWWPGSAKEPACAMTLIVYGNYEASCALQGTLFMDHYLLGVFHDNAAHYEASGKCSTVDGLVLDSIPPTYDDVDDWWRPGGTGPNVPGFYCGFQNVTATISAIT